MPSKFQSLVRVSTQLTTGLGFGLVPPVDVPEPGGPKPAATFAIPYDQLSIFARSYETSAPLAQLPLYAIAQVGVVPAPQLAAPPAVAQLPPPPPEPLVHVPLGLIGTNHAGYASFDLTVLRTGETIQAFERATERVAEITGKPAPGGSPKLGLRHLWVLPFGDPILITDALRAGDIGPELVVLRLELDEIQLANREMDRPMVAMQNPNILDWRLSPGSFTLAGTVLVGEDGCETLLPSNLSTQIFRFRQVARTEKERLEHDVHFRPGFLFEYTTEWFSVGHSLGQLLYSLPLAPGEIVKLAFVDWSRSDAGTRTEDTGFSESLVHDQLRDRTLSESVHAVLNEWQHGGSIMGGAAASAGMGVAGGAGAGLGLTAALGGAYTTSSGTRDLTAQTSQQISDAFHQATTAVRELRSTVVVQTTQGEKADLRTRVVANYNHSHALTLLYYEVLRHYRVVTRLASVRPALLLDSHDAFNYFKTAADVIPHRQVLEAALLDQRLMSCFDAVEKLYAYSQDPPPTAPDPDKTKLVLFQIRFLTGGMSSQCRVTGSIRDRNNSTTSTVVLDAPNGTPGGTLAPPDEFIALNHQISGQGTPAGGSIEWGKAGFLVLKFDSEATGGQSHTGIKSVDVRGVDNTGIEHPLGRWDGDIVYEIATPDENRYLLIPLAAPAPAPPPTPPRMKLSDDERACNDRLMTHLQSNAYYYNRALWLNEEPNVRANRFDKLTVAGVPLLTLIENRALEVLGQFVAFPVNAGMEMAAGRPFEIDYRQPPAGADTFIEQLLTLPTRGVFGEAKLGSCNASEKIDDTRFWDWQKSPIPFAPPDITGVDAGSRAKDLTGLTPTQFPQPVVNIVNPGALPDPTGLAGAMGVLSTPGIFRDMSGVQQVGALLGKLSDNATGLAGAAMKNQARQELIDQIRNAPELSAAQKKDLIGQVLGGAAQDSKSPAVPPAPSGTTPTPATPTPAGTGTDKVDLGGGMTAPPSPVPQPAKPQRPNPPPARKGLLFHISFQNPVVATTPQGTVNVSISPVGTLPVTPQGDDPGYIPGETIGPPVKGVLAPEVFNNRSFKGALDLQTDHSTAPGEIYITAWYNLLVFEKGDIQAVFATDTAGATRIDPKAKTFRYDNHITYAAPKQGNIINLEVVPHVGPPVTVSGENATELAKDWGNKVTGSMEVISIDGHLDTKSGTTTKSVMTYTVYYVTGGLDIKQTN